MRSTPRICCLIAVLCFVVMMAASCTIVPDKEQENAEKGELDIYFVNDAFKPDVYVEKIWEDKVVPYFKEKCLPIGDVIPTWKDDQTAAGKKFGYREKAEGSPWNFRVKGAGKIIAANTESRASTVDVDLDDDGKADMVMQIGPVIKDTGIRDSCEFISFTDFTNQLEFARLSNAFNKKVNKAVLQSLDRENLVGKSVEFYGVFTQLQDSDLIRVTPVVLDVE